MDELMALFATQPTTTIARALLGMYLEHETPEGTVGGYIVDCEAYLGPDDLAAHSVGMRNTPRVRAMYQEPVRFIYIRCIRIESSTLLRSQKASRKES